MTGESRPGARHSTTAESREAPTVFLCHSAQDRALASGLKAALLERGIRDVWYDEEDVQYADHWTEAVLPAIVRQDVFLYLSSDAALRSSACQLELAHASDSGKRIVVAVLEACALVGRVAEAVRVPLGAHPTDPELDHLFELVVLDAAFAQVHSALEFQAAQWQQGFGALPAWGAALRAAGTLRRLERRSLPPQPTGRMRRFVEAGVRRTVFQIAGLLMACVGALVIVAYLWREVRDAAEKRRLDSADLLAAGAQRYLPSQPDRAALLAVAAWRLGPEAPAVLAALHDVVSLPIARYLRPTERLGETTDRWIADLVMWRDTAVVLDASGVQLDPPDGGRSARIELGDGARVRASRLSSVDQRGQLVVAFDREASDGLCFQRVDLNDRVRVGVPSCTQIESTAAVARAGAAELVYADGAAAWRVRPAEAGVATEPAALPSCPGVPDEVGALAWNDVTARWAVACERPPRVCIGRFGTGVAPVCSEPLLGPAEVLAWRPDGGAIAARIRDQGTTRLAILDVGPVGPPVARLTMHAAFDIEARLPIVYSLDGTTLFVGDVRGRIGRYETKYGQPRGSPWPAHGFAVTVLDRAQNGELVSAGGDGSVVRWRIGRPPVLARRLHEGVDSFDWQSEPWGLALATDDQVRVEREPLHSVCSWTSRAPVRGVALGEESTLGWTADGVVRIAPDCSVETVYERAPDEAAVAWAGWGLSSKIRVLSKSGSLREGKAATTLRRIADGVDWAAGDASSELTGRGRSLEIHTSTDTTKIENVGIPRAWIASRSLLASGGDQVDIELRSSAEGLTRVCRHPATLGEMLEIWPSFDDLHASADGRRIAAALDSAGVLVCDTDTATPIFSARFEDGFANARQVRLAVDGRAALVLLDRELWQIDLRGDTAAAALCTMANRSFTREESEAAFGSGPRIEPCTSGRDPAR